MYVTDDSDMKIVGEQSEKMDESDAEARLYRHEHANGNLEKAHAIGKNFADALFCGDEIPCDEIGISGFEATCQSILFAFTADRVLDTFMPNHIIARSAQNTFFDEMRKRSPSLYESVSRSGAFSMYLLCKRSGDGRYIGIGSVYAGIVRKPEDEKAVAEGEALYNKYYNYCIEHIKNVEFAF